MLFFKTNYNFNYNWDTICFYLPPSRPHFSTDLHYILQEYVFLHQMMTI